MSTTEDYGSLFRSAYKVLHGDEPEEAHRDPRRRPDESLEQYLARSRGEALEGLRARIEAAEPPEELRLAHGLLSRLLACAVEADAALAAQVAAYGCGNMEESISHSDRLHSIISESARLDRELIDTLRKAEESSPGTLDALGIAGLGGLPGPE